MPRTKHLVFVIQFHEVTLDEKISLYIFYAHYVTCEIMCEILYFRTNFSMIKLKFNQAEKWKGVAQPHCTFILLGCI